jgi:RNA polymerase sigma-70 factor (ECF subfamily)
MPSQHRIYAYIFTLVPNRADADDLLQQTITVMWRKFDEFIVDRDFVKWGIGIARLEILTYRKEQKRMAARLNPNTIELLETEAQQVLHYLDDRIEALRNCLSKLTDKQRNLIYLRYNKNCTLQNISDYLNRPIHTIYRCLIKINDTLLRCMRNNLAERDLI